MAAMAQKPVFLKPSDSWSSSTTNNTNLDRREVTTTEATDFIYNRHHTQSIQAQRQHLPIFNNRNHILYLLEKHQVLILVGETGCGKSTQIPQYLHEAGWPLQIGVCQPRRVAAITLAHRVADETGTICQHSGTVGYAVRFDSKCAQPPKIKYMTEGILLREIMSDPLLNSYSVIMLDEVHERSLYTDILLGLMKKILRKRRDFKVIVASATVNANELRGFFAAHGATDRCSVSVLSVKGRQFPCTVYYAHEPVADYVTGAVELALKIATQNTRELGGDVLIFLTGQEDVDKAVRLLQEHLQKIRNLSKIIALPMYGSLPFPEQLKVFRSAPDGHTKIVCATNIAEASVTIPGIVHVIDCGFVKLRWFNPDTQIDSLITVPVSKASADQRAGRAGRVRPGKVYRLYTEREAESLPDVTPPEIVRTRLTYAVLQLKAFGINDLFKFSFPDPPPVSNVKSALEILYALGAINLDGHLTPELGYNMAEFALDPLYTKILLKSGEFGCTEEVLTIVAMLQVEVVFTKPSSTTNVLKARVQKRLFEVAEGDLITLLNVYNGFVVSDLSKQYCQQNFLNHKSMLRVVELRERFKKMLQSTSSVPMVSSNNNTETICKCLVTGLFPNTAYLHSSGVYKTVRGDIELYIHPDSVLYTLKQPQWVMFCDVTQLHSRLYMRDLTVIQSEWLLELVPHFYHKTTLREELFS